MRPSNWFYVRYACGHKIRTRLDLLRFQPEWRRKRYIKELGKELCPSCANRKNGLPGLLGTSKQISWAEGIRRQIWKSKDNVLEMVKLWFPANHAYAIQKIHEEAMADFFGHKEAKWIIEHQYWFSEKNDRLETDSLYWSLVLPQIKSLTPDQLAVPFDVCLQENRKAGLPALTGSEADIYMAEQIRAQVLRNQFWFLRRALQPAGPSQRDVLRACHASVMNQYLSHSDAAWYIQNRDWFGKNNNGLLAADEIMPWQAAIRQEIKASHPEYNSMIGKII